MSIRDKFERCLQFYDIGMMNSHVMTSLLNKTNNLRSEVAQSSLQQTVRNDDLTMQAHDPGGYGQGKVIYEHTNHLRQLVDQEILVSSDAKADLDMHSLNLHEEETQVLFKTDAYETQVQEINDSDSSEEEDAYPDELPEQVFLSRVIQKPKMSYPVMSDSGASNDVFGKGSLATRILQNYVVCHDDEERGYVKREDYHKKSPVKAARRNKHVVVANGDISPGKSVDQLELGVEGRTWDYEKNDWSDHKRPVFLRLENATVCEKLTSSVFSEGNFLRNQPGWSIISHGDEKYMI
jgi:hypothetical protein